MSEDASGAFRETYADLYDRLLVPLLFAPYAQIITRHALRTSPRAILETAAGTGSSRTNWRGTCRLARR
jgi:hypothetical protein